MEFKRIADIKRLDFITEVLYSQLPPDAEVLDVGCGNGVIARSLGEKGFRVQGVDVSEKAIERARLLNKCSHVKFDVVSAEQLVADGKQYHAVICSEVLEHLNNPQLLLATLRHILKDNGVLIVTVPNGKGPREVLITKPIISLQKKNNWTWKWVQKIKTAFGYSGTTVQSAADDLTHIQFFTKSSLEKLAKKNQFSIVRFGKTNFIDDVFPFSFFTKKIKRLQKWDSVLADKLPHRFTGGFLTVWQKTS